MTAEAAPPERIFYDGDCGVCHRAVRFVVRRDPGARFRFAPLEGEVFARTVPPAVGRDLPDSLVVATADGELLWRSRAVAHILRRLGPGWRLLGRLLAFLPEAVSDWFYDRFAGQRRRLAAAPTGACPLLPPELRKRFDL